MPFIVLKGIYVVFYEYPFVIGLSFPFTPLARSFIEVLNLSPGQSMPQIWRIFFVVQRVTSDWRRPFNLADLMYTYDLKMKECNRYTLGTKKGMSNLGVGLGVNDRGWQSRFVFVNKDSLGESDSFLVEGWTTKGNIVFLFGFCCFTERRLTWCCFAVINASLAGLNSDSYDKL